MESGIHAGDPLIDQICDVLDRYHIQYSLTKQSGAKKGDGDIHTKGLYNNIAFDGKYKITPPVNPSITIKELLKVSKQAKSCDRFGSIITNTKDGLVVCLTIEDFLSIISCTKWTDHDGI
jgi:hypothetical protein